MAYNTFDRRLTKNEIDYVLFHLSMHIESEKPLDEIINYSNDSKDGVMIPVSDGPVCPCYVNDIPVLFPMSDRKDILYTDGSNVIFCHDVIKSAFYLLSGYQEFHDNDLDQWHRPKWENSIQHKFNFTCRPIVNYYFKWILESIEYYASANNITVRRKNIFTRPVIHLTHDIDLVRYFSLKKTLYRCAQVVGLRHADTHRSNIAKAAFRSLLNVVHLTQSKNPYWTFDEMMNTERYFGYKSTFFFLPNDGGPFSADYELNDDDINSVMTRIIMHGNDVGLHAPILCQSAERFKTYLQQLSSAIHDSKPFCRHHFLAIQHDTLKEMDNAGITIDCSAGYSHSEGYRNSYCLPFHPFCHDEQRMLDIWEVPLVMMDTTMLTHKNMTYDEIFQSVGNLLDETRQFNGCFSMLWHNSTFDETYHKDILKFYEDLHLFFSQYSMQSMTCSELLEVLSKA